MISVNMQIKLLLIALMCMIVGCASMTPRYSISDDQSELDENQAALLQIPSSIQLLSFDDNVPPRNVRLPFASQSTVQHRYREVLIKPGVHFLIFQHFHRAQVKYSDGQSAQVMQRAPFIAAFEAMPGHTYRLQTRGLVRGKYYYGWIESIPKLMARHKIKPGINFDEQFRYWYDQDWQIVAAGTTLDDSGKPQYQEIYSDAERTVLGEFIKGSEMPTRETYWPTIEDAVAASKAGVEKIKSFISNQ